MHVQIVFKVKVIYRLFDVIFLLINHAMLLFTGLCHIFTSKLCVLKTRLISELKRALQTHNTQNNVPHMPGQG